LHGFELFGELTMDILITGRSGVGKTTLCEKLLDKLQAKGFSCAGVVCPDVKKEGVSLGKVAVNLRTKESRMLATIQSGPGGGRVASYALNAQAVEMTAGIIKSSNAANIIILDDIGPVDLKATGIGLIVQETLNSRDNLIIIVRSSLMDAFTRRFLDRGFSVFEVTEKNRDELVDRIVSYAEKSLKTEEKKPMMFTH
jgi:nucleoside-triphosphatase